MNKFKNFFSKYWIFILLAAIATILAGFYFKNKISPPQVSEKLLSLSIPEIESSPIAVTLNVSPLEKNFPSFPQKLEVYQVTSPSFSNQEAIKIAQGLGFQDKPLIFNDVKGPLYTWSGDINNLSINLHEGKISYGLDLLNHPEIVKGAPPPLSEAETKTKEFLIEKGFFPPEKVRLEIKESYYAKAVGSYFEKSSLEDKETTLTHLMLEYKINNRRVAGSELISVSIYIGAEFKIIRFDYQPSFKKIELLDFYPLKTKEEIIQNIKSEPQISFIKTSKNYLEDYLPTKETSQNITSLTFENIELVYYKYDPLQVYLQPVFLITGKAILKNGQEGGVSFYLPAIKEEYLLK